MTKLERYNTLRNIMADMYGDSNRAYDMGNYAKARELTQYANSLMGVLDSLEAEAEKELETQTEKVLRRIIGLVG